MIKKIMSNNDGGMEMISTQTISQVTANQQLSSLPKPILDNILRIFRQDHQTSRNKKSLKNQNEMISMFYINPLTYKISIWNFIIIFTVYFIDFQISLTLAFGPKFWEKEMHQAVYKSLYIFLLILLSMDILANLNKGYYAFGHGKVISNPMLIFKRYLKSYLIIDLVCISLLIIPIFVSSYGLNFLQIISIVLLFFKKFKCQQEIQRSLQVTPTLRTFFILSMLGCDLFLMGNFGACVFLGIDLYLWKFQFFGNNPQYYWLSNNANYKQNLIDGPWMIQYVYAQQFSTGTLSTLAPGPFGKNPVQITFQLFVMISFIILTSYVAEIIMINLASKSQIRIFHNNNIIKFTNFMILKEISESLRSRVNNFFQLIWQFQVKNQSSTEMNVVGKLPMNLIEELYSQISFSHQIRFIQYFQLRQEITKVVSFKLKSYIVDPNTQIFELGQNLDSLGQRYLYYFKYGMVKYYFPLDKHQSIISLSNILKLVGEYQFVTNLSYTLSAKSIDLCVVEKISFSDMMKIILNFGLREQFQVLRCKVLLYGKLKFINKYCIICDERHMERNCPLVMINEDVLEQFKEVEKKPRSEQKRIKYDRKYINDGRNKKIIKNSNKKQNKKQNKAEYQNITTDLNVYSDMVYKYQKYYPHYNISR